MWTIDEKIDDPSAPRKYVNVNLNLEKPLFLAKWFAPIIWEGYVGGKKVKIFQNSPDGIGKDANNWTEFHPVFSMYQADIISFIRRAQHVMD